MAFVVGTREHRRATPARQQSAAQKVEHVFFINTVALFGAERLINCFFTFSGTLFKHGFR